jgi:hypothetical protein
MSLWRRQHHSTLKSRRRGGFSSVVLKIDENSDIWSNQSTKSDAKSDTKSDSKSDTKSDTTVQHKDVQTSPILPPGKMNQTIYDVVIVGAGPAGLMLA